MKPEKPRKLIDLIGRKVAVQAIQSPQDHPQVKRFNLGHPKAKAFYLSTSVGSVNSNQCFQLGQFFVVDTGKKLSAVERLEVNRWMVNLSAVAA